MRGARDMSAAADDVIVVVLTPPGEVDAILCVCVFADGVYSYAAFMSTRLQGCRHNEEKNTLYIKGNVSIYSTLGLPGST